MVDYPKDFAPQQPDSVIEKFAVRRKRQFIVAGVVILFALVAFVDKFGLTTMAEMGVDPAWFGPIFLSIVLAAMAFSFWNWRCPACNKYLGRSLSVSYCQKCGAKLRKTD